MTSLIRKASRFINYAVDGSIRTRIAYSRLQHKINTVEGFLVPGQEYWLYSTALKLRNGARIVEIGSFKGRSTVCLAFACTGTRKHVFAIDRWQGLYADFNNQPDKHDMLRDGFFHIWNDNIIRNDLRDYVTPLAGDSAEIAKTWRAPIEMIFIDGSHHYEDVIADFEGFYPYITTGGVVAIHDVTPEWDGCWRAWHEHIAPRLKHVGSCSTIGFGYK